MQPFFFIWDIDPQSFAHISLLVHPPPPSLHLCLPVTVHQAGSVSDLSARHFSLSFPFEATPNGKRAQSPWKEETEETKSDRGRETKSVSLIKISSVLTHLGLVYRNPDRQYLPRSWEEPGSCSLKKSINWFRSGSIVVTMLCRFEDRCVEELLLASPGRGAN